MSFSDAFTVSDQTWTEALNNVQHSGRHRKKREQIRIIRINNRINELFLRATWSVFYRSDDCIRRSLDSDSRPSSMPLSCRLWTTAGLTL